MCGIVGYIGKASTSQILIDGLKELEYRGYDSAGIAILENDKFDVFNFHRYVSNEYVKGSFTGLRINGQ